MSGSLKNPTGVPASRLLQKRRFDRGSRWLQIIIALGRILASAFSLTAAAAEARVALVIGNGAYRDAKRRLAEPANDAAAMARALKATGLPSYNRGDPCVRAAPKIDCNEPSPP
jgi:hypothetical protein